jgi:hypothetical protein
VDGSGDVYFTDLSHNELDELTPSGLLTVIAGGGSIVPSTSSVLATSAVLSAPFGVAVNALGTTVYIADQGHHEVDEVTGGQLSVIAGGGATAPSTTPETATSAHLMSPIGLLLDGSGDLFVADTAGGEVYEVTGGQLSVIAGGGATAPSTTPETATAARWSGAYELAVYGSDLYVTDPGASEVYEIDIPAAAPTFSADSPASSATVGTSYGYTFVAAESPAPTYALVGIVPSWLSIGASTGTVVGTPPSGTTTFSYAVSASNGINPVATTATFTVATSPASVAAPAPPVTVPTTVAVPVTLPVTPPATALPVPSPLLVPTGGGAAATPTGAGYWALSPAGALSRHGNAGNFGSENTAMLNAPIVAVGSTTSGRGYWLAGADGGVFNFGDARFFGSLSATHLDAPIVAISRAANNGGYLLAGADGGVFAFGDATFEGSMATTHLNRAITSMVAAPGGEGYWLVGADGGVFSFGGAHFYGSLGAINVNRHIVGIAATPDGKGYWLVGANGAVSAFGDAKSFGSLAASSITRIVGIVADGNVGYRLITAQGNAVAFGTTPTS